MTQLQMCSKGVGFAVALTACVGLSTTAMARPGTDIPPGTTVTQAQMAAGITVTGTTADNTNFDDVGPLTMPPTDCGASTAPDEWYLLACTAAIAVDINGCTTGGTTYDQKIFIRDSAGQPVDCNDDSCGVGGPAALINLALTPQNYDLAMDGFGTSSGVYSVVISPFVPVVCFLTPACAGNPEFPGGEPCNEAPAGRLNDGCNITPAAFGAITLDGPAVCGVNWGNGGSRDTDWLAFSLAAQTIIELELHAETNSVSFIATMSAGGACPVAGIPDGTPAFSGSCDTNNILGDGYDLPAGNYIAFVGTGTAAGGGVFDGFPCSATPTTTNNAYKINMRTGTAPPPPCPWDLNGNGSVDFADILQVIANWGPCPTA